jgi:hypothetical protein
VRLAHARWRDLGAREANQAATHAHAHHTHTRHAQAGVQGGVASARGRQARGSEAVLPLRRPPWRPAGAARAVRRGGQRPSTARDAGALRARTHLCDAERGRGGRHLGPAAEHEVAVVVAPRRQPLQRDLQAVWRRAGVAPWACESVCSRVCVCTVCVCTCVCVCVCVCSSVRVPAGHVTRTARRPPPPPNARAGPTSMSSRTSYAASRRNRWKLRSR